MRINNNITAINSHRQYGINNGNIGKNVEKLSSGFRVNRAADDAAGLAISEKMRAQIRGLNMASKNAQDAISLVQIAEGGLAAVQDIVQRIRELAVQGANDTNTQLDRDSIAKEVFALTAEINQIGDSTEFNTMKLFHTALPGGINEMVFQVGANAGQELQMNYDLNNDIGLGSPYNFNVGQVTDGQPHHYLWVVHRVLNHVGLALQGAGDPYNYGDQYVHDTYPDRTQQGWISTFINSQCDWAINSISKFRASLGAVQNRLEFKIQNLNNAAENMAAAESRIRDADMAKMMTEFTKNNILFQASTAMLAQANALPQGVLQLLG